MKYSYGRAYRWIGLFVVLLGTFSTVYAKPEGQVQSEVQAKNLVLGDVKFNPNPVWQQVKNIDLSKNGEHFNFKPGPGILVNKPKGKLGSKAAMLTTANHYGDLRLEMEVNLTKNTWAAVYFSGRYGIGLSNIYGWKKWGDNAMGSVYPRWDEDRQWRAYDGVKASRNASKAPGVWQKIEIDFKAPRFDAEGFKTAYAHFIEVKINGETVQSNQVAIGPSRFSMAEDDASSGPIAFYNGSKGFLAVRDLKITPMNFSDRILRLFLTLYLQVQQL